MSWILVTGGAGFFGSIMKAELITRGYSVVSVDLQKDESQIDGLISYQGDICDYKLMETIFSEYEFDAVIHLAAFLAHEVKDKKALWNSNVIGTELVRDLCIKHNVKKIIFTSSNCLWAENMTNLVTEDKEPNPVEIYGKSKLQGEKILMEDNRIQATIFRCPTIVDEGRLGLLALLFEFIDENKKLPLVGDGENKYQFIYAKDLANACMLALNKNERGIYNIGSDNVKTFNEVYQYVIEKSGSKSKMLHFPKGLLTFAMKVCYILHISPLGPYQYKMISSSFVFDTTKIKKELDWQPTLTNEEMLLRSYTYYKENRSEIEQRKDVSAHKKGAKMGIAIKILKFFC